MKKCIKCKTTKLLSDYYTHAGMADGHLNKCKECSLKESRERIKLLSSDKDWIQKERKRNREKYYRLNYKDSITQTAESKAKIIKRHKLKYPEKHKARSLSQKIPCKKGNHLHHWSYKIDHAKDVIELPVSVHFTLHRYLRYDQSLMLYRDLDGNILNTKEKHLTYLYNVLKNVK